ncbi:winged helix-turn-helix transcriptional regulator [Kitasatospora sp. NPDC059747]|uniref:winged helix-turn-helix transcriptional regulator n=1 Tax=Kitasatospora sp. NPDC059747 TaxID=3346930 RepID=UPI00366151DA
MPSSPEFTRTDPQRVETALRWLAPKWTTAFVITMAREGGPMRVHELNRHYPSLAQASVSNRLTAMAEAGLARRDAYSLPYQLTQRSLTLGPAYRELTEWSRTHINPAPMDRAERIEDALQRIHHLDTTAIVSHLGEHGSARYVQLCDAIGLDSSQLGFRLGRLQANGLVTRTGEHHGAPYTLTDAGRALGPVYAAVERWDLRHDSAQPAPVPTAARTHAGALTGPDSARTAAALRRSPVPAAYFSHAPQPQVPASATATSSQARGR